MRYAEYSLGDGDCGFLVVEITCQCVEAAGDAAAKDTPFIYNPSEARSREEQTKEAAAQAAAQWICGETATVEVQIWNPTSQPIKASTPQALLPAHL